MKINRKFILSLIIATLLLSSCGDDSPPIDPKGSNKLSDFITEFKWFILFIEQTQEPYLDLNNDGQPDPSVLDLYKSCGKDDLYIFKKDGTYYRNEYMMACDGNNINQIKEKGIWEIKGDYLYITIQLPNGKNRTASLKKLRIYPPNKNISMVIQEKSFSVLQEREFSEDLSYSVEIIFGTNYIND